MIEIPLELMMHAERLYDEGGYKTVPTIIAEAIIAERERLESDEAIDLLTEVRNACLFDDDDGQIGVTTEPSIDSDLFDRICVAINQRRPPA